MTVLRSRLGWSLSILRLRCLSSQLAARFKAINRCSSHASHPHHGSDLLHTTRNIGIIAHIDAGKTTTTERMLYYSGYTRRIGDVDDGSTVTDFLPAERARGITIQSAAVTFHWPPIGESSTAHGQAKSHRSHTINLIDTPGHADFTFEVVRSLRILDGAVCILDGVAGVEAQTEKVWSQANNYSIPRIIHVNKLDREGAAFARTVREIGIRLKGFPAVCQIPWWEGGKGRFMGVGDVINLCGLKWTAGDGKSVQRFSLDELSQEDAGLRASLIEAREALVGALCSYDEHLLEVWMNTGDDCLAVTADAIRASLRLCVLDGSGSLIPVFAGASFRNIGVQPLLDAINYLLPNPTERPDAEIKVGGQTGQLHKLLAGKMDIVPTTQHHLAKSSSVQTSLVKNIEACALAFKVVNDLRRGVLVYVRVYSGSINRNTALYNTNLHSTERAQRLLQMYASDAVEIQSIPAGQIGVIAGLKYARTGDTLMSYHGLNPKIGPHPPLNKLQLRPIDVPPPVFFAAIEPNSLSEQKNVEEMLAVLLREDPSLHIQVNEETGQTLLSGMGELHLEIARDRLVNDFKAKATMGNIEISYRECVLAQTGVHRVVFDREIAGKKCRAGCTATFAEPLSETTRGDKLERAVWKDTFREHTIHRDGNIISIRILTSTSSPSEGPSLPSDLSTSAVQALLNGAIAGLARSPRRAFPIHSSHVTLQFDPIKDYSGPETTSAAISSAARLAVQIALKDALANNNIGFLEPVMEVVISCDESSLGAIVHDLSSARGGHILSLQDSLDSISDSTSNVNLKDIYAPPDPFASSGSGHSSGPGKPRQVTARVPLKEMVGYLKHLRSMTAGRGTFIMSVADFERISGPREKAL